MTFKEKSLKRLLAKNGKTWAFFGQLASDRKRNQLLGEMVLAGFRNQKPKVDLYQDCSITRYTYKHPIGFSAILTEIIVDNSVALEIAFKLPGEF